MTTLIEHHIGNLRLNPQSPFPRHCSDTKDMIRMSRELQNIDTSKRSVAISNTPHAPKTGCFDASGAHPEGFSNNAGESSTSGDTALVYQFDAKSVRDLHRHNKE